MGMGMDRANNPEMELGLEESALLETPENGGDRRGGGGSGSLRDVIILSFAFLLIFLAYGAAQNLESSLNTQASLGTTSLGILYVSFCFFSLFASPVVRFLGSKTSLILGTTGYWLFIAANLSPSWLSMVPASVFLGFAASIIWVGQGTYLTNAARSRSDNPSTIGQFNGLFWAVFASHQLVGNLVTLALLKDDQQSTTLLFVVFLCTMSFGTLLMCFLRTQRDSFASELDHSLLASVIAPLLDRRMLFILPLMAYSGLQQAFVWAEFTKFIVTPTLGVSGVGATMAVYGATDVIFSLAAGRLTSGLKSITFIVSAGVLAQTIVFLLILLKYGVSNGVVGALYPYLMAALLGIGDGVLNTQLNALLGILFKNDTEGAFAQLKVWQSASIAVVFFLSPNISLQAMVWIMVAGIGISYGAFLVLTLVVEKAFSLPTL